MDSWSKSLKIKETHWFQLLHFHWGSVGLIVLRLVYEYLNQFYWVIRRCHRLLILVNRDQLIQYYWGLTLWIMLHCLYLSVLIAYWFTHTSLMTAIVFQATAKGKKHLDFMYNQQHVDSCYFLIWIHFNHLLYFLQLFTFNA